MSIARSLSFHKKKRSQRDQIHSKIRKQIGLEYSPRVSAGTFVYFDTSRVRKGPIPHRGEVAVEKCSGQQIIPSFHGVWK